MIDGLKMRVLRVQNRLTQEQLAANCGITQETISCMERGKCVGTVSTLRAIANTLGCTIEDLLMEE